MHIFAMASSSYTELDHTSDDDAWKDSFDKLLDVKPTLRELNVLKKDVRASFNNDSSVENSRDLSGLLAVPKALPKAVPKKLQTKISTPKLPRQPFKCSISPITLWKVQLSKMTKKKETPVKIRALQSTVIHPEAVVIDFDEEKENSQSANQTVKETSLTSLFMQRKLKRAARMRQVLFDSNVQRKSYQSSVQIQQSEEVRKSSPVKQRPSQKRSSQTKNSRKTSKDKTLTTGKWRKSLSVLRRSQIENAQVRGSGQRSGNRLEAIIDIDDDDESVEFINIIPSSKFVGKRKSMLIKAELVDECEEDVEVKDYREHVLECCNQKEIISFNNYCNRDAISDCYKIGEGVYGEVFLKKELNEQIVCKIIPIEGTVAVNGEVQKTFEQILPEIVISKELCNLNQTNDENTTCGFVGVKKVSCIKGKYPDQLIKYWEKYESEKGSDNDHPGDFPDEQLYIVLELEFGGQDLETFVFENAEQSFAALKQIVLTLAVAEEAFEFEHRDLHWGNVLISATNVSEFTYKLSGEALTLPSMGIKATIIDYTLSRMKYKNHCFYNDLSNDEELFTATGDYQFDIYRLMRDLLGQHWERYEPKTNIYWISYIISKMTNGVKYKNKRSKGHTQYLRKMRALKNESLEYSSSCELVKHLKSL